MSTTLEELIESSPFYGGNAAWIEELYEQFLQDPDSVPADWRRRFLEMLGSEAEKILRESASQAPTPPTATALAEEEPEPACERRVEKQVAVLRLINSYRVRGHQAADIDPLHLRERPRVDDLDPASHGLEPGDLDHHFNTGSLFFRPVASLREIIRFLQKVYTGTIGAEYMHITETAQKRWIQSRLEGADGDYAIPDGQRRELLDRLVAAEGLERYLHTRYVGQKRFSLEGGESLIPMLDQVILDAADAGIREIVIGMAHRGRLNVLVNTLGKSPAELFEEFEGKIDPASRQGSGDVKYHMGFSADARTPGGDVHVALAFNPSHLEIIGPVVEGSVRARQQRYRDTKGRRVLPLLIHGDSAFAGQGVVMENFNMSQARGFHTGGTVHIVINNQIGFTTSNPLDTRSTHYSTDVAKMVQAPIFHVNGDDPEAVLFVTRLAMAFRMEFHKDVVIDLVCYRRHGHNEADEPAVTQPMMYRKIRSRPPVTQLYAQRLQELGVIGGNGLEERLDDYRERLDRGETVARYCVPGARYSLAVDWTPYFGTTWETEVDTTISGQELRDLSERMLQLPDGFELHPRVERILEDRRKMSAGALPMDWGFTENLAYATLLTAGHEVRISGQDSGRGTFFHRHAVLYNQADGERWVPLQHLAEDQAHFIVIDSVLSEEAVLAFEYGYATAVPDSLVIWEAQFGDFANGAQVVIDQFISSGEAKWQRLCGLTLFLPHGFEGQGPEHSSARLERYMQLCAEHNMQVCVPSTAAQMFHLLRRQVLRPYRKPLIVMTPKSMLRNRLSASPIEAITDRGFQTVIGAAVEKPRAVRRVVLCSGKVYYDLEEERRKRGLDEVAIVRIEQLYPFPHEAFDEAVGPYGRATELVWCQEEPLNQGAWYHSQHHIRAHMKPGQKLKYAGRPLSASPATGYFQVHLQQQRALVEDALTGPMEES